MEGKLCACNHSAALPERSSPCQTVMMVRWQWGSELGEPAAPPQLPATRRGGVQDGTMHASLQSSSFAWVFLSESYVLAPLLLHPVPAVTFSLASRFGSCSPGAMGGWRRRK